MPDAPPITPPPDVKPFKEFVPAEYHDRGYLKDILDKPQGAETTAEFFKRFDSAQKLIGQRPAGIPGDDAKAEEVEAFLSKMRPGKAEDYDFKALGEGTKDPRLLEVLRDAFHHAGNSKAQVNRFLEKFVPIFSEREKAIATKQKELDDAFDGLVKQAFGADNAKVLERVNGALAEFTPEPLKPYLGKVTNENLAIMAGVIDAVLKKYGAEDKITPPGGGGAAGGDEAGLRAELSATIALPEYRDEFSPKHGAARAKAQELAQKITAAAQTK